MSFLKRSVFISFGVAVFILTTFAQELKHKTIKFGTSRHKSDNVKTLSGVFSRTFAGEQGIDSTSGAFYYLDSNKMYIQVNYPLHQIMYIEANITTIYYPESKKAFRLESVNPVILPLIPGLLAAIRPDYGLGDLGFELGNQTIKGDTVIASWTHPKAKKKMGAFKIAEVNDRLVYTQYQLPNKVIRMKTTFSNYENVSGVFFPTEIYAKIFNPDGISFEKVLIEDLELNQKIPDHIVNFKIPGDVVVENKKW